MDLTEIEKKYSNTKFSGTSNNLNKKKNLNYNFTINSTNIFSQMK
jgi:hypothetical protein